MGRSHWLPFHFSLAPFAANQAMASSGAVGSFGKRRLPSDPKRYGPDETFSGSGHGHLAKSCATSDGAVGSPHAARLRLSVVLRPSDGRRIEPILGTEDVYFFPIFHLPDFTILIRGQHFGSTADRKHHHWSPVNHHWLARHTGYPPKGCWSAPANDKGRESG